MKASPELLEQRPGLADEEDVRHPLTNPVLGDAPRKYTKAVHDRICDEIASGQRPQGACARAGITMATFYDWMRRGKDGDPWLHQFAEDVEVAKGKAEAKAVDVLTRSGFEAQDMDSDDVKWWLERARPEGYSKHTVQLVDDQQKEFLARLEAALLPMPPRLISGEQILMLIYSVSMGQPVNLGPAQLLPANASEKTSEEQ